MKVLNFSWDNSVLNKESDFAKRIADYAPMADAYCVIVPAGSDCRINLSGGAAVYGVECSGALSIVDRLKFLFKLYKLASKLVKADNYEVISIQDPFELAFVGWLLKRKFSIGLNLQEHGDFFSAKFWRNENFINFLRYYLGKFLIKKADSVRAVSQRIKNTLIEKLKINENKIVTVPIFIDINEQEIFKSSSELLENYKNKFVFFTAGRLVKQKNLPLAIKAFKDITLNISNVVYIIAGRGPESAPLKDLVKKLKLEDKVVFHDWIESNVYEWYKAVDAYILSSNYEGWGMVIVEAASCGLPIIMTDVGCAGELIKDGVSGLVIPVGNQNKLSETMIKIIKDGGARKKISEGARQATLNLLSKDDTLRLYRKSWEIARHYSGNIRTNE